MPNNLKRQKWVLRVLTQLDSSVTQTFPRYFDTEIIAKVALEYASRNPDATVFYYEADSEGKALSGGDVAVLARASDVDRVRAVLNVDLHYVRTRPSSEPTEANAEPAEASAEPMHMDEAQLAHELAKLSDTLIELGPRVREFRQAVTRARDLGIPDDERLVRYGKELSESFQAAQERVDMICILLNIEQEAVK